MLGKDNDHIYRHQVVIEVYRGGVTGEPIARMSGLGDTVAAGVRDALTAGCGTKVRKGDFIKVLSDETIVRLIEGGREG